MSAANPIRVLRERLEVTQEQAALAAGIHRPMLSAVENGHFGADAETLATIKQAIIQVASSKVENLNSVLAECRA